MHSANWTIIVIAAAVSVTASGRSLATPISVQISQGQASYASHCASCHGPTQGGGMGPALKGTEFLSQWSTARKLYSRILTTMPFSAPGTLSPQTVLALTTYLLEQNGVGVGSKARTSPDQLNSLLIRH